jgi:rubrerythrin
MCFRPNSLSKKDEIVQTYTCQTCGMSVEADAYTCPYCGDPIPSDPPEDFSEFDPSYSTRVI